MSHKLNTGRDRVTTDRDRRPFLYQKPPDSEARTGVQTGKNIKNREGENIEAYTLGKIDSERVSESTLTCSSPVCKEKFEQTGVVRLEPRKYCCDRCRLDVWHLREAVKLLENETDQRVIEILRGKP